jgi:thiosulfate/3-mercaptopyruvate sulfurtransferase
VSGAGESPGANVERQTRVLIEVEELAAALAGDRPPVVADVRWTLGGPPGLEDFEGGHIPGARWVDLERELSGPPVGLGGRHPLPSVEVFQRAMRRIGLSADTAVVVCDAADALAASRLWWLLTDSGHADVRVLNGGVAAWRAAGLPLETGSAGPDIEGDFVARTGQRRQLDAAQVGEALARPVPAVVVDVRAAERYSGATEPIDPVAGHIPGAVNLPSMANVTVDGKFLPASELAARYAAAGVGETAIVYCGSGVTAAHTLLALAQTGIPDAHLYPGSWSDWISDRSRPVATGDQP